MTEVYPDRNEPDLFARKIGYLKHSFEQSKTSGQEEVIETRKNPPPNEIWHNRLFVLRDDALLCYEESAPHKVGENVISMSIMPLNDTNFEKIRIQLEDVPEFQIRLRTPASETCQPAKFKFGIGFSSESE